MYPLIKWKDVYVFDTPINVIGYIQSTTYIISYIGCQTTLTFLDKLPANMLFEIVSYLRRYRQKSIIIFPERDQLFVN